MRLQEYVSYVLFRMQKFIFKLHVIDYTIKSFTERHDDYLEKSIEGYFTSELYCLRAPANNKFKLHPLLRLNLTFLDFYTDSIRKQPDVSILSF